MSVRSATVPARLIFPRDRDQTPDTSRPSGGQRQEAPDRQGVDPANRQAVRGEDQILGNQPGANDQREDHHRRANPHRRLAPAPEDDGGPEHVVMFFDRQRPEMAEREPLASERGQDVCSIQPEPESRLFDPREPSNPCVEPRQQRENSGERAIIKREDAQRSPSIKVAESARSIFGVDEDARDQKAGKHEKQVDPAPSRRGSFGDHPSGEIRPRHSQGKVIDQNEQDRHATDPIERRDVAGKIPCDGYPNFRMGDDPTKGAPGKCLVQSHGVILEHATICSEGNTSSVQSRIDHPDLSLTRGSKRLGNPYPVGEPGRRTIQGGADTAMATNIFYINRSIWAMTIARSTHPNSIRFPFAEPCRVGPCESDSPEVRRSGAGFAPGSEC